MVGSLRPGNIGRSGRVVGVGLVRSLVGVGFLDFGLSLVGKFWSNGPNYLRSSPTKTNLRPSDTRLIPTNFIRTNLRPLFISTIPRPDQTNCNQTSPFLSRRFFFIIISFHSFFLHTYGLFFHNYGFFFHNFISLVYALNFFHYLFLLP